MKDEDKTKEELIKELKILREERGEEVFKDFIEHKSAEETLKKSEEKYINLIENVNVSIITVDLQGNLLTLNSRAVSYLGGLAENYINKTVWDIFPPKIAEERFADLQKVIQLGKPVIKEIFIPFKGKTHCFLNSMRPIKNSSGDIYAVLILSSDITEQKQTEEKLKDSEEYLKILFDYAPDAYYINDLKGNFIDGNRAAEKLTGYKREELIGKNFLKLKLLSTKDILKATKSLAKNILGLPTGPEEYILNQKNKSTVEVEISTYPVKIKGITYVLGIARDITERKKTEKALAESEERYCTVFENTGTATVVLEEDMTGSMVNTQFEKLSGYSKEEIENKMKWTDFVIPEDLERMKKYHIARRKAGGKAPTEYEFRMMDRTGNIKDILLKIGMIPNTKKSVASLIDITELRQAEERIKQLNLVLRAIRNINQLIFEEKDRERLLKGACNSLTETRGYYHSWIVLLDKEGKIDILAEAGLGKDFLPMLTLLKKGELTYFGQFALKQEEVVIIEDPASVCPDCPLVKACSDRGSVMAVRLGREGKIYGVMSVSIPAHFITDKEEQALFMEVAGNVVLGLNSIEMREKLDKQTHDLKERVKELKRAMDATIETMSKIVEAKDPYTAGHQQRVSKLATSIAKELNFSEGKIEGIRIASLIHDIGKIGLPTEILSKPIKLSDPEFSLIREHPQIGYNILKSIDFSYPVAEIILQHHERLNGSGYPHHLKGDQILLEARIIGVTDVVEAMSSHRPYRPALGIDKALEEISQNRGILYDPEAVDICFKLFKEKGFKFE